MKRVPTPIYASLAILICWQLLSTFGGISNTLLASPTEVLQTIFESFQSGAAESQKIHVHAFATISRAMEGWALAGGFGILIGLVVGGYKKTYDASEVASEFVRSIPPILFFPLLLVAFNYEIEAYIWTIIIGCFPIMFLTIVKGVQGISEARMDYLYVSGVKQEIILFAKAVEVLPSLLLGLRLTLATALTIAIVTEMVFTPRDGLSLGALARDAEIDFNTPVFYAAILIIGVFGYLSNFLLKWMGRLLGNEDEALI